MRGETKRKGTSRGGLGKPRGKDAPKGKKNESLEMEKCRSIEYRGRKERGKKREKRRNLYTNQGRKGGVQRKEGKSIRERKGGKKIELEQKRGVGILGTKEEKKEREKGKISHK